MKSRFDDIWDGWDSSSPSSILWVCNRKPYLDLPKLSAMAMAMACTTIRNTAPALYYHSVHSLPCARSHNTSVIVLNSFSSSLFANREVRIALKSQFRPTDQFVASSALATMASTAEKDSASELESKPFGVLFVCLGKMLLRNWALLLFIYLIYTLKNCSTLNQNFKLGDILVLQRGIFRGNYLLE